jgi:hypothetical protein
MNRRKEKGRKESREKVKKNAWNRDSYKRKEKGE